MSVQEEGLLLLPLALRFRIVVCRYQNQNGMMQADLTFWTAASVHEVCQVSLAQLPLARAAVALCRYRQAAKPIYVFWLAS